MSRRLTAHSLPRLPSSALPPPPALGPRRPSSSRSPELRENEAVAAAAAAASSGGCDSLTGAIDGRRRGFHGGIYLRQDGAAGIKKRGREGSAAGRARRGSFSHPVRPRSRGARVGAATPPLPRSYVSSAFARASPTRSRLFREGVGTVSLSMEAGTFLDPVKEEDLFSKSE